jgi:hypothetical protein
MSDTPDTDDAQFGTGRVGVDFARRLERERNAAQEINARLREIISRASRDYDEQIELFRAECNKLRDIAERAIDLALAYYDGPCERDGAKLRAELDQLKSRK